MSRAEPYARLFSDLDNHDVSEVGGKNASLGEMTLRLGNAGIRVPEGVASTARAYRDFLAHDHLSARIEALPDASVVNQKYRNIKRRLFPHGCVARRCHRARYVASSRLALRKNPSVLFVPLFLIHDTSFAGRHESCLNIRGG